MEQEQKWIRAIQRRNSRDAAEDFAARVHDQALLEAIEAYVSGLDPGEQAVFRLRIYGEKTFPEIAAALEEPEAAVKSRYYRLMGRLRKEFDADV